MRVFTVINQKGGCGKTTTAINLSSAFAHAGCRTLLVDLDPQSHCAAGLGVPEDRIDLDVSDALRAPEDQEFNRARYIWRISRNLDLLPSRMKLAGIEAAKGGLADQENKELRLRSVLKRFNKIQESSKKPSSDSGGVESDDSELCVPDVAFDQAPDQSSERYDVCVIDCPPSIGLLSYNAVAAGREVIIPVETSFFSLKGAAKQVQTTRSIARRIGMRIHPRLLATMHNPKQPLARDLLDDLRNRFGAGIIPVVVRFDHALREAASFGQPIEEYDPRAMGTEDYRSLCEWLMENTQIERQEPGAEPQELDLSVQSVDGAGAPTLASASVEIASSNHGGKLSRAQELAIRARVLQQEHASTQVQSAPTQSTAVMESKAVDSKPVPLKRSMMPHRPVAIELVDDRVVKPSQVGVDVTRVRHLFGVRKSSKGILFVQPQSIGQVVEIAGDFNDWKPELTQMVLNEALGVFEKHLELKPGSYEYRLVVDGHWVNDEYNPKLKTNGLGGVNNEVCVDPK